MRFFFRFLLVCFCCEFTSSAFAQHFALQQFQLQSSLPSTFVYKVYEDQKGYIWFLTDKGIAYYNGNQIKHMRQADGYQSAGAFHVVEDKTGALWFLTVDFKIYKFSNNRFVRVPTPLRIGWIDTDENGVILAASRDSVDRFSLHAIHPSTLNIAQISKPFDDLPFNMLVVNRNHILFGFGNSIISYRNKVSKFLLPSYTYQNKVPARLHRVGKSIYLSNHVGLYEYDSVNSSAILKYAFPHNEIVSVQQYDQFTWVATQNGLYRFTDSITPLSKPEMFLQQKAVMGILKSRDQVFWIPTYEQGVFVSNFQSKQINAVEGLVGEKISFIRKDGNRLCFFGRSPYYYAYQNGNLTRYKLPVYTPFKHKDNIVANVLYLPDSALFVHGKSSGIISKGNILSDPFMQGNLPPIQATTPNGLVYFNDGALWLNAIQRCLVNNKQLLALRTEVEKKNLTLSKLIPIFIDGDTYYFQTDNGLISAQWNQDADLPQWHNLPVSGKVSHVCKWNQAIVVSTHTDGLFIVNGNQSLHYTTSNGLLSMYIERTMVIDNQLWICTNQGLSSISDLASMRIRHFTANDFLLDNEVLDVALFHDTLFVATATAVSMFPKQANAPIYIPSVLVEKIEINQQPWLLTNQYELDYHQNNILLQVASPGYRFANQKAYRVFITKDNQTDTLYYQSPNIQLSSLSSGDYSVSVSVQHIDEYWSKPTDPIQFKISAPFWRTLWFWTLLFALSILIVLLYIRFRFINRQTELNVKRKLVESELRSLRLHMNPHFIFNLLTSLQAFILTNQNSKAERFIAKFSKLIRSIMGYSVKGQLLLVEEIAFLNNYVELEKIRFQHPFQTRIHYAADIEPNQMIIPSLLVQPFIENAIKHGIKDVASKLGEIEVYFYKNDDELWCRIVDNGVGRDFNKSNQQHESTGIRFTEERIQLLLNKPNIQMVFITDLVNQNLPCGTCVEVRIPDLTKYD